MKHAQVDYKNAGTDNPLGDYPQTSRSHLERERYSPARITQYVLGVDALSQFLRQSNATIKDLDEDRAVNLLMQSDRSLQWKKKTVFVVRSFIRFLQVLGVAKPLLPAAASDTARGCLRREYEEYLRRQRGLSERTIFHSWRLADRFLEFRFGKEIGDLSQITARDITGFLQQLTTRKLPLRDKTLSSHLRNFFRYLFKARKRRPIWPWAFRALHSDMGRDCHGI